MRTVVRSSLLVLLTASAAATATVSLGVRDEPARPAAPPVLRVAAPGFVEPRHGELTISARQAGTLTDMLVQEGQSVKAGEPLLTMGDLSRRRVRAEFRDGDILKLKAGQPSRIQAGFGGSTCDGSVERLGVSAVTRSVSVERSTERIDYRVVEAWIALAADCRLPVGARVDVLVCLDETDRGCSSRTDPGTKPPDQPRERVVAAER